MQHKKISSNQFEIHLLNILQMNPCLLVKVVQSQDCKLCKAKTVIIPMCSAQCIFATIELMNNKTCFDLAEGIYTCKLLYLRDSIILLQGVLKVLDKQALFPIDLCVIVDILSCYRSYIFNKAVRKHFYFLWIL